MEDLPNRIAMDVAIHPLDSRVSIWYSPDTIPSMSSRWLMTANWTSIDGDLPDIPVNTVLIDSGTAR